MILKLLNITKSHYNVALEHITENKLIHTPTYFQALKITLHDTLFNKTIYDNKSKSHLVYEVVKMPTLGLRVANVIRIYVPKEYRGENIASSMLDKIKEKKVISSRGNYGEVGRLYVSRINL